MGVLLSVTGGKDGVGKSTFALHLAMGLMQSPNLKVCMVEADVRNLGDFATLLNSRESKTLVDFIKETAKMDSKVALSWIGKHAPTGLSLLNSATFTTDFQNLDDVAADRALKLLAKTYDYVIVDAGADLNPLSFRVFENSDLIFVVTDSDILSVNQAGEHLKRLRALHFSNEQLRLVVNRYNPSGVVNPQLLRQKMQLEARILLPADAPSFSQSVATAKPLQLINPKHPYVKALDEALRVVGEAVKAVKPAAPKAGAAQIFDSLKNVLPFTYGGGASNKLVAKSGGANDPIRTRNISIRLRVHERLLELVDLRQMDAMQLEKDPRKREELKNQTIQAVHRLLEEEAKEVQDRKERAGLAKEILDEALGLGPIEPLLESLEVTEIMVNGYNRIFVEQKGKVFLSDLQFTSEKQLMSCVDRILSPIGRRVDEKTPLCDGRLKDGSRINVIIPPLALSGATLTIRKFFKEKMQISDLVKYGSLTEEMADFLRAAVQAHLNIIVSGGTGSGKTTLLNLVSGFIPENERIITVEDAAELQLPQPHVITLETRPPNLQGEGAITIRDLVRNTLRMRPDRIVVGECRGGEALDMLQAMNTGHDGSLTTIHSNNPRDCLRRIETLVMMAGFDMPITAIREQIGGAVHLIVQLRRYSDGTRKISHVTEVMGMEGDTIVTQPIFEYKQTGTDDKGKVVGTYQPSGLIPKFVETLKSKGIQLPKGMFGGGPASTGSPASSSPSSQPAVAANVMVGVAKTEPASSSQSRPGAPTPKPIPRPSMGSGPSSGPMPIRPPMKGRP